MKPFNNPSINMFPRLTAVNFSFYFNVYFLVVFSSECYIAMFNKVPLYKMFHLNLLKRNSFSAQIVPRIIEKTLPLTCTHGKLNKKYFDAF